MRHPRGDALDAARRGQLPAAADRRFCRRRYDAEPSAGQIGLEVLNRELLGITNDTVQPSSASLWLRD